MRLFFAHYFDCLFSGKRLRFIFVNRGYWNAALLAICVVLFFATLFFVQKPDGAIQDALSSLAIAIPFILTGMIIPLEERGQRSATAIVAIGVNLIGIMIMWRGVYSLIDHFNASYHVAFDNSIYIALGIYAVSCLLDAWSLTSRDLRRKKSIQRTDAQDMH